MIFAFYFLDMKKLLLTFLLCSIGCSTQETSILNANGYNGPGIGPKIIHLKPRGKVAKNSNPPIIKHIPYASKNTEGLRVNDRIVGVNNTPITTLDDFHKSISRSPRTASITVNRGGALRNINLPLEEERPRLNVDFEPAGVSFVRESSPNVSFMHQGPLTLYALASKEESGDRYRLSVMVDSVTPMANAKASFTIKRKKDGKILATGKQLLQNIGKKPVILNRTFKAGSELNGPLEILLALGSKKFSFEFQ